jgi:predicted amidophosphoribosyltransferase
MRDVRRAGGRAWPLVCRVLRPHRVVTEPCCACCGVPFATVAQGGPDLLCPSCRAAPPEFGRARAALRYDGHARRLILPFKHADRTEMAAALAPLMARAGAALLREADLLVPVPLHRSRLLQRRYNQAALLARALAKIARVPALPDAMIRLRRTAPLGERSAAERHAEVAEAFAVRPSRAARIAARRVVLVDDSLDVRRDRERLRRGAQGRGRGRRRCARGGARARPPAALSGVWRERRRGPRNSDATALL